MLDTLASLWLPIVVSAVAVWITSALFWMLINHHDGDYVALPADTEIDLVTKLRSGGVAAGAYLFPHVRNCGGDKKAQQAKFMEGPCGTLTVFRKPDGAQMGRNMLLSVLVYFIIAVFIAYLAALALPTVKGDGSASFKRVFQFCATAGVVAYAFAPTVNGIWFGQSTRALLLTVVDGIVYGLVTGAVFGWLWPR
jgi:hypothetical protein